MKIPSCLLHSTHKEFSQVPLSQICQTLYFLAPLGAHIPSAYPLFLYLRCFITASPTFRPRKATPLNFPVSRSVMCLIIYPYLLVNTFFYYFSIFFILFGIAIANIFKIQHFISQIQYIISYYIFLIFCVYFIRNTQFDIKYTYYIYRKTESQTYKCFRLGYILFKVNYNCF